MTMTIGKSISRQKSSVAGLTYSSGTSRLRAL